MESRKIVQMTLFAGQESRGRCREWACGRWVGREEWGGLGEWHSHVYTASCVTDSWWGAAVEHRERKQCSDSPEESDEGEGLKAGNTCILNV